MRRYREERLHESWQQPEAFDDDTGLRSEPQKVLDDQVETLAIEPMEGLQHDSWRSEQPALIHAHRHELVQQRGAFAPGTTRVILHLVVGRVEAELVPGREPARDGRLPRPTPATNPEDVSQ